MSEEVTSRKEVFQKLFQTGKALSFGGLLWGVVSNGVADVKNALRPPGASLIDEEFVQACIKCGKCVEVCPYDTLKLAKPNEGKTVGTPYFEPRDIPCYMCTDIPCTNNCPSGALDIRRLVSRRKVDDTINNAQMGLAVIHKETCLAYWGVQCDVCYRACPLMDSALKQNKEINKVTQKHANILPVVDSDFCTGCGICEHVCIVEKPAIFVLPREMATGKVDNHYIKSWKQSDENRIDGSKSLPSKNAGSELNYLNDDDKLYE